MATATNVATRAESPAAAPRAARTSTPRVDIYETDRTFVLIADVPGVAPDGLEIVAESGSLNIHGRVLPSQATPLYSEFELGDYHRQFMLTEDLDTDNIAATLRDGVLRLEIPKSPQVQPRKIPVRTE